MGRISHILFAPHTPRIHAAEFRDEEPWSLMVAGLEEMAKDVRSLDLQAMVAVSAHWISTFPIYVDSNPRHQGVLTAPEAPDLICDVPYDIAGQQDLARQLVAAGQAAGLPVREASSRALVLDYGTVEPLRHLYPDDAAASPPLVPTSVCLKSDRDECLEWGRTIAAAVGETDLDVGLLVSGSLSHQLVRQPEKWPDPEHRELDDEIIGHGIAGRVDAFVDTISRGLTQVEIEMEARHLFTAAGVMGAQGDWSGQLYGYGPSSGSGNPVMLLSRGDA